MRRLLVLLLVCSPLLAAPASKDGPKGPFYFPTTEGAKRVMETSVDGAIAKGNLENTETVTKVEAKDGKYLVTTQREYGGKVKFAKAMTTMVYEVSGKGLSRVGGAGKPLSEPLALLKLDAKPGDTWTTGDMTLTRGKEEEIEVPAGKYKAIVLTSETDRNGQTLKMTMWLAEGVGLVKSVAAINGIETTNVLKSFVAGK